MPKANTTRPTLRQSTVSSTARVKARRAWRRGTRSTSNSSPSAAPSPSASASCPSWASGCRLIRRTGATRSRRRTPSPPCSRARQTRRRWPAPPCRSRAGRRAAPRRARSIPRDVRMDTSMSSKRTTSSTPVTVRWLRSSSVTACGRRCGAAFLSSYGIGSPPGSGLLPQYARAGGHMQRSSRGSCTVPERRCRCAARRDSLPLEGKVARRPRRDG